MIEGAVGYPWPVMNRINATQPIVVGDNRLFLLSGYGAGAAVIELSKASDRLTVREVWRNTRMKNRFASSVLHEGVIYGLDESILAAIDANTGELKWKGGRYGYGQLLLVNGRLIVLTEDGDLALVGRRREARRAVALPRARRKDLESAGYLWRLPARTEPGRDGRLRSEDFTMNPIGTSAIVALALLAVAPSLVVSGQEAAPRQGAPKEQAAPAVRMVADEGEAAKHWARWRGPSGQGLVSGAGYPDSWSPTQNVLWKTALSGEGNSSPIVWGDRIFVTTVDENGRRVSRSPIAGRMAPSCGKHSHPRADSAGAATTRTVTRPRRRRPMASASTCHSARAAWWHSTWTASSCGTRPVRWTRITEPPARHCSTRTGSSSIRTSSPGRSSLPSTRGRARTCGGPSVMATSGGARRWPCASSITTRSSSAVSSGCRCITRTPARSCGAAAAWATR